MSSNANPMARPDAIVIGAGINGLVAAASLARAGRRVLVLERCAVPGGQARTHAADGVTTGLVHASGALRADIAHALGLPPRPATPGALHALQADGSLLRLPASAHDAEGLAALARLSPRDAARWPEFADFMDRAAGWLERAYATPMPRLADAAIRAEAWPLGKLTWQLRRLGGRTLFRLVRALPMTALELVEEWFESEALRAAICSVAVHGHTLGPMSAGSGYTLLHNWLLRGGLAHRGDGAGLQAQIDGLAGALTAAGGVLRTATEVARITVENGQATGVELASGETIAAACVLSAADPRHTLLDLVGARELPPEFVWATQSLRLRGAIAKLHLDTDGSHGLPAGTVVYAPSVRYLERAFDAAKYGAIAEHPALEITHAGPRVSVHVQSAAFALREGDWNTRREEPAQRALAVLAGPAAALCRAVRTVTTLTPLDLQQEFGLSEGDPNHGQLQLDQSFFLRPLPGCSDHTTPIAGLYLCGNGCHGGGGISGIPGRNAAMRLA